MASKVEVPRNLVNVSAEEIRSIRGLLKDIIEAANSEDELFEAEWSLEASNDNRFDVIVGRAESAIERLSEMVD